MAHILRLKILKCITIGLLLCEILSCKDKAPKEYEGEMLNITQKDTVPLIIKKNQTNRPNIKTLFEKIPKYFFNSSLFPEISTIEKQEMFSSSKNWKDLVIDTANHYIFFDKEIKDKNKGILTSIKAFPFTDGAELVVVEISKWSDENTETEDIKCLKIEKNGTEIELSKYNVFPEIQLQDFFKKDITTQLKMQDHNSMPALLYEVQRDKNAIYVFLGEWKHQNETFSYKPDIDFVELRWEDNHFVKISM